MANYFPEELIEEVRLSNDIVDIISGYVVLKKKGRNYSGLCPFHHEKTPSFMVSPDKQIFHCFGCGVGGNVISFIMQKENLTFPEAMRMLADKAGISLPEKENPAEAKKNQVRQIAYSINEQAGEYFHQMLVNSEAGREALNYLIKRGADREIINRFKLGYALPSWDGLLSYLKKNGCQEKDLARIGLVLAKERSGGFYDRFRNRVMFPIMDTRGRVVGFGGRVMDDSQPKYLNSPESEIFNKSNLLFGLNFAAGPIREDDQVIVMEGYMDVLTAHQFGIKNAVASLGTALTREQGKLLMRYTHNVVISYDADQAGVAATIRGLEMLQELGCRVSVLTVPDGKDPDEFIKKKGPEAFKKLISEAVSLIEYKLDKAMEKFDTTRVEGKLAVAGELFINLKNMDTVVQREEAISLIAGKLGLFPESIRLEYEKFIQNERNKLNKRDKLTRNRYNNNMSVIGNQGLQAPEAPSKETPRERAESALLRLMLEDGAIFAKVKQEIGLEFFRRPEYIKIIKVLEEELKSNPYIEISKVMAKFADDETVSRLLAELLLREFSYGNPVTAVDSIISTIRKMDADSQKERLLREISAAEKSGDRRLLEKLLRDYQKLF